jgi:hypothetical protein
LLTPRGLVVLGLEELILITQEKGCPQLSERKIQVTGRRLLKFIPPVWKPRKGVAHLEQKVCVQSMVDEEKIRNVQIRRQATRCNRNSGEEFKCWVPGA